MYVRVARVVVVVVVIVIGARRGRVRVGRLGVVIAVRGWRGLVPLAVVLAHGAAQMVVPTWKNKTKKSKISPKFFLNFFTIKNQMK